MTTVVAPLLEVVVHGTPAPQGSKRHVGNGRMVESSKAVGPWREAVKAAVLQHWSPGLAIMTPLDVDIQFRLDRPLSHYGSGANGGKVRPNAPKWPSRRPDIDKLVRSTLDALGDVGVYGDDSQVVLLTAAKIYASAGNGAAGATITVRSMQ